MVLKASQLKLDIQVLSSNCQFSSICNSKSMKESTSGTSIGQDTTSPRSRNARSQSSVQPRRSATLTPTDRETTCTHCAQSRAMLSTTHSTRENSSHLSKARARRKNSADGHDCKTNRCWTSWRPTCSTSSKAWTSMDWQLQLIKHHICKKNHRLRRKQLVSNQTCKALIDQARKFKRPTSLSWKAKMPAHLKNWMRENHMRIERASKILSPQSISESMQSVHQVFSH